MTYAVRADYISGGDLGPDTPTAEVYIDSDNGFDKVVLADGMLSCWYSGEIQLVRTNVISVSIVPHVRVL